MSDEKTAQEIVLIRRRSHDDEEHGHSGLWKIAYADFMTALMAFFLVMWLVNAANKKTLQQVATYFNPVRMTDQVTSQKGVNNLAGQEKPSEGDKPENAEAKDGAVAPEKEPETDAKVSTVDEQGVFRDPYGLLAELSKKATTFRRGEEEVPEGGSKNTEHDVYSGGEGFRDPFDPDFRAEPGKVEELPSDPPVADGSETSEDGPPPMVAMRPDVAAAPAGESGPGAGPGAKAAEPPVGKPIEAGVGTHDAAAAKSAVAPAPGEPTSTPNGAATVTAPEATAGEAAAAQTQPANASGADTQKDREQEIAEARAKELNQLVGQIKAEAKTPIPNIDVKATPEGVLVSLTDDAKFGMFAVGSAKPRPELVAVMERISGMLRDLPGPVIVRGHTDARPYKSKDYDNWRLSSARAHMAYYMLVRGGVGETRFDRIEGHADRELRLPADPNAAQNRRIEILIKTVTP